MQQLHPRVCPTLPAISNRTLAVVVSAVFLLTVRRALALIFTPAKELVREGAACWPAKGVRKEAEACREGREKGGALRP